MWLSILSILLLSFATSAVAGILVTGQIFEKLRQIKWLPIHCFYCTTVWVAACFAAFSPTVFDNMYVNYIVMVFAIHRIAFLGANRGWV
jgi:hypothetical protein